MRLQATNEAKAALGYLMGDLRTLTSTYRKLDYSDDGNQATIERRDGKRFVVAVREIVE